LSSRRFLVLHLPMLATDRIHHQEPELRNLAVATWTTQGSRRVLVGVNAPGTTLRPGQALADAQAMHPGLVLRPADIDADLAFLDRLALWALRFTPLASGDPPDGLVLDITGCTDQQGGEAGLLRKASAALLQGGVAAIAVCAGVADAAAVLARSGHHGRIVPPGDETAAIAGLPLAELRLQPDCLAGLHRLGLLTIGDGLRQPRAPLMRRFGKKLLDVLDAVTGERPRPLPPVRPPPVFLAAQTFLEPIVTRPAIDRALDDLLDQLCPELAQAGQGARQLTLRAFRVDRDVQEVTIGTGLPTRLPAHLRRLFADKLGQLEPDLGFERITLQADIVNTWDAAQDAMASSGTDPSRHRQDLAQLVDRLSQRLPVWRLAPAASHWPERSVTRADPFAAVGRFPARSHLPMPLRVRRRPLRLMVTALVPDGPPVQLRLDGKVHRVAWADGPERIEPEWWCDPTDRRNRDYYRVELDSGARLWVARAGARFSDQPARWFLHGYLP
jgi:protein ImuB